MERVEPAQAAAIPGLGARRTFTFPWRRGLVLRRARVALVAGGFALGTVATRLPLRGRYLFNWDALQFALGIQRFDLAAHRPHPPGYIGYIYLGRLLTHLTGATIESVLTAVSIAGEAATVVGLYLVARRLFGEFAGLAAALLLLSSPLYWMYGETALTYGLEPGLALLGFWLLYRASRQAGRGLVLAAGVIGLEGAIRESSEVFLLPALAAVALLVIRRGSPGRVALWPWPPPHCSPRPRSGRCRCSRSAVAWLHTFAPRPLWVSGVTVSSAIWRAGLGGLNLDASAVLNGLMMSLGVFLPIALAVWLLRLAEGPRPGPAPDRTVVVLAALCLAPALVTYLLIHIGQLAYVLFGVPLLLLFAGPVLTRLARLIVPRGALSHVRLRSVALVVCVAANVAVFLVPANSLAGQVRARDQHVAAVTAAVRWFDPSTTVLLTDPEGPSSYRTAMYYLPEYDVVAVGRDWHGRAGEMFSNRGGAPEYDLARFGHAGPLRLPAVGTGLILDQAVLRSIGDPQWLTPSRYGSGPTDRMYLARLDPADPALSKADFIYLRGSDCPCRGRHPGRPLTRPGAPI